LNYGQFTYQSSIAYHDSDTNKEVNICVDLSRYGSKSTTPSLDKVYYLAGRFVGMTEAPIIFFEQQMSLQIGSSEAYMSALAGKVAVWGMGIVVNRSEFQTPGMNNVLQTNLRITIQHMDYHNIVSHPHLTFHIFGTCTYHFYAALFRTEARSISRPVTSSPETAYLDPHTPYSKSAESSS
jgi:hypothetical protein